MEFDGKRVLVTGAARGIGQAVCEALAKAGSRVVIADINGDGAENAASLIREQGGDAIGIRCDVSNDSDVEALEQTINRHFGGVDILINNAVAHQLAPGAVDVIDLERWARALDINVMGYVRLIRLFVPPMLARATGYVVTTSSSLAILPNKATQYMLPYITSKGAALGLSYGLAYSLRPRGVLASVFCPGLTSTTDDGTSKIAALGFLDEVPKSVTTPATSRFAAQALLDGMRREDFLICSQPDFENSLNQFAHNRLDPFSDFQ